MEWNTENSAKRAETLASTVTAELRRDIISGVISPGAKLKVRQLAMHFGVGLSPVREALNRLSRESVVQHSDLRGFSVAAVSEQGLEEMTLARCWVNERALRESIARGDERWEERVLVSHHRLDRIPRRAAGAGDVNPAWEIAHREFHRTLIDACGSQYVIAYCDQLFDIADLYRHMARSAAGASNREQLDEHKQIMTAAIARDVEAAVEALMQHFTRTAELCRTLFKQQRAASTGRRRPERRQ